MAVVARDLWSSRDGDNIIDFPQGQKSNEWVGLALQADLCYNKRVNIVVSEGASNTTQTLIHLIRRCIVNTVPHSANNDNSPSKKQRTGPLSRPLAERFWEKVNVRTINECWEWNACTYHHGYGKFSLTRCHPVYAHRVAYELTYGSIPPGLLVCHTCDNRPCCNPSHLFVGTQKDNMQDCKRKGRMSMPPHNKYIAKAIDTPRQSVLSLSLWNGGDV